MRMLRAGERHLLFAHIYPAQFCLYAAQETGRGICMSLGTIAVGRIPVPSGLYWKSDAQIHQGSGS